MATLASFPDVLATGDEGGKICLWDIRTGVLHNTLAGHTGSITKILMVDSDTLISSSKDSTVIVWDIRTAQRRLLLTGGNDGPICVWNLEDGSCLHVLQGHDTLVWVLEFNEDATLLATGASQAAVHWKLWRVPHAISGWWWVGSIETLLNFGSDPVTRLA
ncbi:WD40 repeat-like protein [Bimuria novae-zelandiae CBS 107.79]|uniref:WD40 repeat-like protein n=1 Tax=Bimuria novae-zelandiae CBS 107.79 TaxID=1447943 RepID=A0A6A5VSG8_9PLEO|nr:WD40 repeat-like protein [Bimuria novae-zelandiae CBS 107.79]